MRPGNIIKAAGLAIVTTDNLFASSDSGVDCHAQFMPG